MTELMQASRQWSSRPADERFTSLEDMLASMNVQRMESRAYVLPSTHIEAMPALNDVAKGLVIEAGHGDYSPTNYAFGQLATLAGAPAGYLRTLPAPLAADCINLGLKVTRAIEDVGLLVQSNGTKTLRAATGPNYGRIWNADIVSNLIDRFGDGISGDWRVPGEFGNRVEVTKDNTTLFASDRDMFVFLADEDHKIELPNRRNGQVGLLSRGFFVWNSEVGDKTFGIGTFLFDYVCCNRIVWGAEEYKEVRLRHTTKAPERFLEEVAPALEAMSKSSTHSITAAIEHAREARLGDKLDDFLANRFSRGMIKELKARHEIEEGRPMETLWDITTAATAVARDIKFTDERVKLERQAGEIMGLAA